MTNGHFKPGKGESVVELKHRCEVAESLVLDLSKKLAAAEAEAKKNARNSALLERLAEFVCRKYSYQFGEVKDESDLFYGFSRAGVPEWWGECVYGGGDKYLGGWKAGKPHGFGKCDFAYGNAYEGEWANGGYHGKGLYTSANGDQYEGVWENDERHGCGRFVDTKTSRRYMEWWDRGKQVKREEIPATGDYSHYSQNFRSEDERPSTTSYFKRTSSDDFGGAGGPNVRTSWAGGGHANAKRTSTATPRSRGSSYSGGPGERASTAGGMGGRSREPPGFDDPMGGPAGGKPGDGRRRTTYANSNPSRRNVQEMRRDLHSARRRERYKSEVADFERRVDAGDVIHMQDIPFPPASSILDTGITPAEQRKSLRDLMLRWHPDKWMSRNLAPEEREQIMTKVTQVFQRIDKQRQELEDSTK